MQLEEEVEKTTTDMEANTVNITGKRTTIDITMDDEPMCYRRKLGIDTSVQGTGTDQTDTSAHPLLFKFHKTNEVETYWSSKFTEPLKLHSIAYLSRFLTKDYSEAIRFVGDEHELIEKVSEMVQSAKDAHEDRDLRLLKELLVYEQSVKYDLEVFELTNDRASLIDACNDWWTLFLEALFKIYENV